jgi:hypothetical protein
MAFFRQHVWPGCVAFLLVTAAFLGPAAADASASTKRADVLTFSVPPQGVVGKDVVTHGRLTDARRRPMAGRKVVISWASLGSGLWHVLDTVRTDSGGRFTDRFTVPSSVQFRARFAGDAHFQAKASVGRPISIAQAWDPPRDAQGNALPDGTTGYDSADCAYTLVVNDAIRYFSWVPLPYCAYPSQGGDTNAWLFHYRGTTASTWYIAVDDVTEPGYSLWQYKGSSWWERCPTTGCSASGPDILLADNSWYPLNAYLAGLTNPAWIQSAAQQLLAQAQALSPTAASQQAVAYSAAAMATASQAAARTVTATAGSQAAVAQLQHELAVLQAQAAAAQQQAQAAATAASTVSTQVQTGIYDPNGSLLLLDNTASEIGGLSQYGPNCPGSCYYEDGTPYYGG